MRTRSIDSEESQYRGGAAERQITRKNKGMNDRERDRLNYFSNRLSEARRLTGAGEQEERVTALIKSIGQLAKTESNIKEHEAYLGDRTPYHVCMIELVGAAFFALDELPSKLILDLKLSDMEEAIGRVNAKEA